MEKMNEQDIRQAAGGAAAEDIPAGWTPKNRIDPRANACSEFVSNSSCTYQYGRRCCEDCVNFTEARSIGAGIGYCTKGM